MRNYKLWLISLFLFVCIIFTCLTAMATAEARRNISAQSAALYSPDLDCFLYGKNIDVRLPMASTTKIMTALVVLEYTDTDSMVMVDKEATNIEGSSIYLKEGDVLSVNDLLYALLLQSANDAAAALAFNVSGSIEGFADLMNNKAKSIGLRNTHFTNPHGLDDELHYTTAHDLALITAEAIKNSTFADIIATKKYTFTLGNSTRTVINHNKLLWQSEYAVGVKTGYTKKSGRCLVGAAEHDGISLITVTLNAPDDWSDHKTLFNAGFNALKATQISDIVKTEFKVPILNYSTEAEASLKHQPLLVGMATDIFKAEVRLPKYIVAPIKYGEKIGEIIIYKNGEYHTTLELTSDSEYTLPKKKSIFNFLI